MESKHRYEHEILYVSCHKCGSDHMLVVVTEGALLLTCGSCGTECGMFSDLEQETRELLAQGCGHHK